MPFHGVHVIHDFQLLFKKQRILYIVEEFAYVQGHANFKRKGFKLQSKICF